MKKIFTFVLVKCIMMTPLLIFGEEGIYIGVQGGGNFLESNYLKKNNCSFDTGYSVGATGGYGWCNGLGLEGEIAYRDNNYRLHGVNEETAPTTFHGHINTWSFLANGYYDFPVCFLGIMTPYIGAGIGCDRVRQSVKIEGENFTGSNTSFAWQLTGGAALYLFQDVTLTVEYKFHRAPLRSGHELQNHSIIVGLKKLILL